MINIILCGASGRMGRFIAEEAGKSDCLQIVAGVDQFPSPADFPIVPTFSDLKVSADVIIDFSNPSTLESLLAYTKENRLPVVIATTGYTDEQIRAIHAAAEEIPVFFTFNMSLGVNLLANLAKRAAEVLGDGFDIEIIEKHHNQKLDAPSGTAIMLANAVNSAFDDQLNYEYDRHSKRAKRPKNEIGIHSVRGGTIVGEHEVLFAGHDEIISLSHSARSREIFAVGALRAAQFLCSRPAGLYQMDDLMN